MQALMQRVREYAFPESDEPRAIPRFDVLVIAAVVVAGVALVGADIMQRWVLPERHVQLDIDGHYNIPTWVHATVLSLAAGAAVLTSLTYYDNMRRWQWLIIAAALAFFSLDKSVSLHEIAGRNLADAVGVSRDWGSIVWVTAWSPLMLGAALFMFLRVREADGRTQMWVAAGILIAGTKVMMDPFASVLINSGITSESGTIYGIEVNIEESLQLLGFGCLLAGFSQFAVDRVMLAGRDLPEDAVMEATAHDEQVLDDQRALVTPGPPRTRPPARR